MDIHKLKIFLTVYKYESISKAARELNISQPTVTEHIRFLENYLQVKLFDRVGRSIKPTEYAHILYEKSRSLVENFLNLEEELKGEQFSEIKIFSSSIPGNYILPYIIVEYLKENPKYCVSLDVSDSVSVVKSILEDEGFIGVVGTKLTDNRLDYHFFMRDEIVLVAGANYNIPNIVSLKDLKGHKFIIREEGSGTRREVERYFAKEKVDLKDLKINLILQSNEAIKRVLMTGQYLTFMSKLSIGEELKMGKLKEIKIRKVKIERNFYIVTRKNRTLPLRYKNFLNFLIKKTETILL
jgi:DNA-binding transcriptional LysR family regulator